MMFGRKLNAKEKKDWKQYYALGMSNGWCSGDYAIADGNFIVEEDRLNKNSCFAIDDLETLRQFFINGNWCLGQAVIYKNLCFIQQVNGGDEWLTIKMFSDGKARSFESISMRPVAMSYWSDDERERDNLQLYLDEKERGKSKGYYESQHYFSKLINELIEAKLFKHYDTKKYPNSTVVHYGKLYPEYEQSEPIAV